MTVALAYPNSRTNYGGHRSEGLFVDEDDRVYSYRDHIDIMYRQGYVDVVRWHLDLEPTPATVRIRGSVIHMEFFTGFYPAHGVAA
tara:strand:- start:17977 stop:18234 length:258 start_codon:yes stop_codon:yes gene_type:complete